MKFPEIIAFSTLGILFIFTGLFAGWLVAFIMVVSFAVLASIAYLVLNKIDKMKLKKIRGGYNEEKNESRPGVRPTNFRGQKFERGDGFEGTEFPASNESVIEEPGTNQLPSVNNINRIETEPREDETSVKRNRFHRI